MISCTSEKSSKLQSVVSFLQCLYFMDFNWMAFSFPAPAVKHSVQSPYFNHMLLSHMKNSACCWCAWIMSMLMICLCLTALEANAAILLLPSLFKEKAEALYSLNQVSRIWYSDQGRIVRFSEVIQGKCSYENIQSNRLKLTQISIWQISHIAHEVATDFLYFGIVIPFYSS